MQWNLNKTQEIRIKLVLLTLTDQTAVYLTHRRKISGFKPCHPSAIYRNVRYLRCLSDRSPQDPRAWEGERVCGAALRASEGIPVPAAGSDQPVVKCDQAETAPLSPRDWKVGGGRPNRGAHTEGRRKEVVTEDGKKRKTKKIMVPSSRLPTRARARVGWGMCGCGWESACVRVPVREHKQEDRAYKGIRAPRGLPPAAHQKPQPHHQKLIKRTAGSRTSVRGALVWRLPLDKAFTPCEYLCVWICTKLPFFLLRLKNLLFSPVSHTALLFLSMHSFTRPLVLKCVRFALWHRCPPRTILQLITTQSLSACGHKT